MLKLTIGGATARSKFTPKAIELDWDTLPQTARDFAILYGVKQYLADGVAGAKSQSEFDSGIDERLDKLAKGDFTRKATERGPVDDVATLSRKIARDEIATKLGDKWKAIDKDGKATVLAKYVEAHAKRLEAEAKRQIDSRKGAADDIMALFDDEAKKALGL